MAKKQTEVVNEKTVDMETGEILTPGTEHINPEMKDEEGLHIVRTRTVRESLISGADFWDFEQEPVFEGAYVKEVIREKDGPDAATDPNQKAGSIMGYLFVTDDGDEAIIGNSHSVAKAISKCAPKDYLRFQYLGKGQTASNKPFNRFKIDLLD